jgi:hypothetical protein
VVECTPKSRYVTVVMPLLSPAHVHQFRALHICMHCPVQKWMAPVTDADLEAKWGNSTEADCRMQKSCFLGIVSWEDQERLVLGEAGLSEVRRLEEASLAAHAQVDKDDKAASKQKKAKPLKTPSKVRRAVKMYLNIILICVTPCLFA